MYIVCLLDVMPVVRFAWCSFALALRLSLIHVSICCVFIVDLSVCLDVDSTCVVPRPKIVNFSFDLIAYVSLPPWIT